MGLTPLLRTIDAIEFGGQTIAAHRSLGGVCLHPMGAQMSRELLSPLPKSCLSDIEPDSLLAHSLHNHMDMRMRLICMQDHRVPVLERERLSREVLDCL
jgi:hypothetical protein